MKGLYHEEGAEVVETLPSEIIINDTPGIIQGFRKHNNDNEIVKQSLFHIEVVVNTTHDRW